MAVTSAKRAVVKKAVKTSVKAKAVKPSASVIKKSVAPKVTKPVAKKVVVEKVEKPVAKEAALKPVVKETDEKLVKRAGKAQEYSVDLKELLEAGAHFGHQARRWNPKMAPYIFTTRDNVHIFDLAISADLLVKAMEFVRDFVASGKEIVFVGSKRQAQAIVKEEAINAGAPFVTERWLGGIITNWEEIYKRIKKLKDLKDKREKGEFKHYTKKERVMIDKDITKLERFFGGIAHLTERPVALFIVDTHKEEVAVAEAAQAKVPMVGLVDSNGDPDPIDYVIPVNDDAVRTIKLVVTKIAQAYADGKAMRK